MTIKKQFVELVEFLQENENKKVSTIMNDIMSFVESKKKESTYMTNEDGEVVAIFCWYHKQWEVVSEVEFGSKANTKTGLNTMCKIGTSKWTKAQRDAKDANQNLLNDVASGEVEPAQILELQATIENDRNRMNTEDIPQGFESEEEITNYLK